MGLRVRGLGGVGWGCGRVIIIGYGFDEGGIILSTHCLSTVVYSYSLDSYLRYSIQLVLYIALLLFTSTSRELCFMFVLYLFL